MYYDIDCLLCDRRCKMYDILCIVPHIIKPADIYPDILT